MSKIIIVSNRLPIKIKKNKNSYEFINSSGGLATGMDSIHSKKDTLWIGWPGIAEDELNKNILNDLNQFLDTKNFKAVNLNKKEIKDFYYGLSNKSLWPLFHYFIEYSVFDKSNWDSYKKVNDKFAKCIIENYKEGDLIWIHDYQLMLCPKMVRDLLPNSIIGFFLHIPFPSFEIFRIFPWRVELLKGILGADLVGFHTYNYQRHFLSSVKRILMANVKINRVSVGTRQVVVNTFPMGIDFEKYNNSAKEYFNKNHNYFEKNSRNVKNILTIDRLDYTKGIVQRIKAFEIFLDTYPEYLERVKLIMLSVPSRENVSDYKKLKKETDEIVGRINGKYTTVTWTPISYYYRSMSFNQLIELYMKSDVAMITPVRDGMNLVAKEYIATRVNGDGVLILSEMAGASKELFEAIQINPFDLNNMSESIYRALTMPKEEQIKRNLSMQNRIKRYNVELWANEFINSLNNKNEIKSSGDVKKINDSLKQSIIEKFRISKKRVIFLDYDGTLVGFNKKPELALPDKSLYKLIDKIISYKNTELVIVSGRDTKFLEKCFGKLNLTLVAEHGIFMKKNNESWVSKYTRKRKWLDDLRPLFQSFSDRTPGTFIEEKQTSLVWHYRGSDPELAAHRVIELKTELRSLISQDLTLMDMNKAIEVKSATFNKGIAVNEIIRQKNYDFILCLGDDVTDEDMFINLPKSAFTIKVGKSNTKAKYFLENHNDVRSFLDNLTG
ncbi:MAG: bifunctional alpha,alpha-trehalose-phosphate synthase (UDP-forming)/trehalose-phosphatase [Crocinitomicaceae bacterium]|nr:bifunctional alpha,alpha-trehalose-phosphate synthase (UDP-forming)/trehalose-phosphatase [Crocinitomicaceae bacterium]